MRSERRPGLAGRKRWLALFLLCAAGAVGLGVWVSQAPPREVVLDADRGTWSRTAPPTIDGLEPTEEPSPAADTPENPWAVGRGVNFNFTELHGDKSLPVAYDRCVPIHVEINTRTGGRDAESIVTEALEEVGHLAGLEFVIDGRTDRLPDFAEPLSRGKLERPVLVAWTDEVETPEVAGNRLGIASSTSAELGIRRQYYSGQVALDGPDLQKRPQAERRAVILHELGHLVGLDHVDDPKELMNRTYVGRTTWGKGDLHGFAFLSVVPCTP